MSRNAMKNEENFREPSEFERRVMQRLLTVPFPGKDEIATQLNGVQVRTIDDEGSLELHPPRAARVAVAEKLIPVEAQASDEDGVYVHFLLYAREGFVNELEIYKDDGTPIKQMPKPDALEVIVLPK